MLSINDYDYHLPAELIAQEPLTERDQARMLVLDRAAGSMAHSRFSRLPEWLSDGDVLVVNNTRVFPARLRGHKDSGGKVEALLLAPPKLGENGGLPRRAEARALCKASKPPKVGQKLFFGSELSGEITAVDASPGKLRCVLKSSNRDLRQVLAEAGDMPLPPYIRRPAGEEDAHRYQTVFASQTGAVAAPTAGLHFTPEVFRELEAKGVEIVYLTLHVGPGTFQPVRAEDYSRHRLLPEYFSLSAESAAAINRARAAGKKHRGRGHHQRPGVGGTVSRRAGAAGGRVLRAVYLPRLPVSGCGPADHQFPSAQIHPAPAGERLCRPGVRAAGLSGRHCRGLSFL